MKAHLPSSSSPSSSAAFYSSVAKKAHFSPFLLTLVLFLLLFSFLYGEDLRAISQQAQASSHLNIHRNNNHHNNEHDQPAPPPPEMAKGTKKRWQGRLPFALNDEDEDEECDVFSGSWVRDEETHPLYQEADCPYIQPQLTCQARGRPDRGYQFWRWQPHDCTLPVFVP